MIEFSQILKDNDYKKAASIHYGRNKINIIFPILGIILSIAGLIMLNILLLRFSGKFILFVIADIGLIVYGISIIFKKWFYIRKILKSAKKDKNYGSEMFLKFFDDGSCEARENNEESKTGINNFYGYYHSGDLILLYPEKNIFFILKKQAGLENNFYGLIKLFDKLGIKSL